MAVVQFSKRRRGGGRRDGPRVIRAHSVGVWKTLDALFSVRRCLGIHHVKCVAYYIYIYLCIALKCLPPFKRSFVFGSREVVCIHVCEG